MSFFCASALARKWENFLSKKLELIISIVKKIAFASRKKNQNKFVCVSQFSVLYSYFRSAFFPSRERGKEIT